MFASVYDWLIDWCIFIFIPASREILRRIRTRLRFDRFSMYFCCSLFETAKASNDNNYRKAFYLKAQQRDQWPGLELNPDRVVRQHVCTMLVIDYYQRVYAIVSVLSLYIWFVPFHCSGVGYKVEIFSGATDSRFLRLVCCVLFMFL